MGRLIGYARVSTVTQDPSLQLDALAAAGCERVYTDKVSGKLTTRPQLDRALRALQAGDTLVVWRLDRLGRSLPHLLQLVMDLESRGVGFRSLTESIDTSSAAGRLVLAVFGALAAFERDLLSERTAAGLAAARARGRRGGRPPVMTEAKLEVARRLVAEGELSMAEIAATIGVGRSTLYRHLSASDTEGQAVPRQPPGVAREPSSA